MSTAATATHIRHHGSILAPAEKRALVWIAKRLPRSITSDDLSLLGLVSIALAGFSFAAFRWTNWPAAIGVVCSLAANWFGDSLDGTVARVRGAERPRYGYYVDHAIDLAGTSMLLAGLAASALMSPVVALALLAAFLLVAAESFLAAHTVGVFSLSFLGVGPTELRIMLAAGALAAARTPSLEAAGVEVRFFDVAGVVGCAGLIVAFAASAIKNTRALYVAEPVRGARSRQRG
jgi:archaetidylinositol phosphate synthase